MKRLLLLSLLIATPVLADGPSFRSGSEVWIAAAAHAPGSNDTTWRTDVWIQAAGSTSAVPVDVLYFPFATGAPGSTSSPVRVTVPAKGQLAITDILGSAFGVESGAGALRFKVAAEAAPATIIVASRTFNNASSGTYGQFIGAIPTSAAFGKDDGTAATAQQTIGLLSDADYRTNLGVFNVSETGAAKVTIELRARSGELLGALTETHPPLAGKQYNRIFDVIGVEPSNDARAVVRVTSDEGRVLAYASIVDNRTGDPIFVPGANGQ